MSYKIVVDSCCELPEKLLNDVRFEIVPLGLEVGGYRIMDDEIREVDKDLVEFKVEDVEEPYLRILSVKRTYDVENHKLFNVLVAFRFEDYTKTLDDYVYEFHVSEKVE